MQYLEIQTLYGVTFIQIKGKEAKSMYWLTGIAGFFLMVFPYLFHYADNQAALWTSIIIGLVVIIASAWEGFERRKENWEYWVTGIVGIFAIVAPFILGFGSVTPATWTTVIMGVIITLLAGSKLWTGTSQV